MSKDKTNEINISVDDPLIDPVDDCLDRDLFAKRIFTLIDSTPLEGQELLKDARQKKLGLVFKKRGI